MPWPSVADLTGAIQQPDLCFEDRELAQGNPALHPTRGTPLVYAGNFAAVYPVTSGSRKYAVRCFTRAVNNQQSRYGDLNGYLSATLPPTLVEFEFLQRGIRVRGEWYPIVKMEWVNGDPLNKYVVENLNSPNELSRVARRWRGAVSDLLAREIAHNDLQHGNVMVQKDSTIRLVDYDGMFLPQYLGEASPEIGHQNFQHPKRTSADYAGYVDNFPALVIYLSLLALAAAPDARDLWEAFHNEDNLLFKKSDYGDPSRSECFRVLKDSPDSTVRHLAEYLAKCCSLPVGEVPDLEGILTAEIPTAPDVPRTRTAPTISPPPPKPSLFQRPQPPISPREYRRGDLVTGVIRRIDKEGMVISVGLRNEGIVPPQEMRMITDEKREQMQSGDSVTVIHLNNRGPGGMAVCSYDQAHERQAWKDLLELQRSGSEISAKVVEHNKGGIVVDWNGIRGFVPFSQMAPVPKQGRIEHLNGRVGEVARFNILELDPQREDLVLTERRIWHQLLWDSVPERYHVGDIVDGTVTGLMHYGAFVKLEAGVEGLVHISELSAGQAEHAKDIVNKGQQIKVQILSIDTERKRMSLRYLREPDPQPKGIWRWLKR